MAHNSKYGRAWHWQLGLATVGASSAARSATLLRPTFNPALLHVGGTPRRRRKRCGIYRITRTIPEAWSGSEGRCDPVIRIRQAYSRRKQSASQKNNLTQTFTLFESRSYNHPPISLVMAGSQSTIIENNPIGEGLHVFRASFKPICDNAGVSRTRDTLEQLGYEGGEKQRSFVLKWLLTISPTTRT